MRNPSIKYWALPDSAFYVDYKSLRTKDYDFKLQMQALYETVDEPDVHFIQEACHDKYGNESYLCFITENLFPYIRSPLFII